MLSFSNIDQLITLEESTTKPYNPRSPKLKRDPNLEYFKKSIKINNKKIDIIFARDKKNNVLLPKPILDKIKREQEKQKRIQERKLQKEQKDKK